MPKSKGRPRSRIVEREDQLGTMSAVAAYMGVGRTWLWGVKRRERLLREQRIEGVPVAFAGSKTCAQWVKEFIRHPVNAAISPTAPQPRQ